MNSECFLINSLILFSSRNSKLSYFNYKIIADPLVIYIGFSSSSYTVNVPPADDSHLYYLSPIVLEITVTLSATK